MKSPLFKGCTTPPMIMGVPMTPFAIVFMGVLLISVWTTVLLLVILPPILYVMRLITKHDDQQFRLLGLKAQLRLNYFLSGNAKFWRASVYSPIQFTKRKKS